MSEPTVSERLRAVDLYDDHDMHCNAPLFREAADLIDALVKALETFVRYGHYESSTAYVVLVPDQHFHSASAILARAKGETNHE